MARLLFAVLVCCLIQPPPSRADEPTYSIEQVTGDLYRFQGEGRYGVFLVTEEGVMLVNPISAETAAWLKGELRQRFGMDVKLVLYSHADLRYISGGEAFEETAIFVSSMKSKQAIGGIEGVFPPDKIFFTSAKLTLGKGEIYAWHLGPGRTKDFSFFWFPGEKAIYVANAAAVKTLPEGTLDGYAFPNVFDVLDRLTALDFEIVISGQGQLGTKQDLLDHAQYLRELYNAVQEGLDKGETVKQLQSILGFASYEGWEGFDEWRAANIEGVARIIQEDSQDGKISQALKLVAPRYPSYAATRGVKAWVLLQLDIDAEGVPFNIRVIDSDTSKAKKYPKAKAMFEVNAAKALADSRFEPGQPNTDREWLISFSLDRPASSPDPFFGNTRLLVPATDLPRSIFQQNAVRDPR